MNTALNNPTTYAGESLFFCPMCFSTISLVVACGMVFAEIPLTLFPLDQNRGLHRIQMQTLRKSYIRC